MGALQGKVAIVTGAGRGLGRAIAERMAAEGASVAVVTRNRAQADTVVNAIVAAGGEAIPVLCDIADAAQIKAAVVEVVARYGTVDVLVNNAHDTGTMAAQVAEAGEPQLLRQFATGPLASLAFMQACFPYLKDGGRVINFASAVGVIGMAGMLPYAMAKEAIRALTRVAAREWGAHGINVNTVCPVGASETAIEFVGGDVDAASQHSALGRMGSPYDDVAPVVVFLAGPGAQYMTGQSVMVDGGAILDAGR